MRDEFFSKAYELERQGKPFATATVVRAERPTSGKPGDKAIITADGQLIGWVGGSCAWDTVVSEGVAALADNQSRLIRLSAEPEEQRSREGLTDRSMTCFSGGTMEIYIEPHQAKPRLLIVGDLPIGRALAGLGQRLGYHVIGVDTKTQGEGLTETDEMLDDVDQIADRVDPRTWVVVATHGDHDEIAVEHALRARAPYVGLVASRKRAESIRGFLEGRGLGEEDFTVLHAPAGLDIKARRHDEIALSILAEIVQLRRSAKQTEAEAEEAATEPETATASETAIDPICGMTVQVAGARHLLEHDGSTYYFCCGGCLAKFAADPAAYLTPSGSSG
jgi:xanthine dehydrogenase accessory factor